jgi:predicted transcriptional regulator
MARQAVIPIAKIEEALRKSGAIHTKAAAMLGCSPNTVTNYVKRHPRLQRVEEEVRESMADMAEAVVISLVREGNLQAALAYLRAKAKDRGWGPTTEIRGGEVRLQMDLSQLSDDDLRRLARAQRGSGEGDK